MATFRYFIIGGDGKTYPQQIYVNEGRFNNFNDFQAEAQRLINTELQDSGAVQLTLPDLSTGQETLVPEAQKNYNRSNGTTNLGGRTINLTNPAGASIYQGGSSPLLPAGSNIPTLPGMLNASSPETNPSTFYGDVNTGYGAATPGMANSAGQTEATLNTQRQAEIDRQLGVGGFSQGSIPFYGAGDGPQNVLRDSARGSGIPITREESSATSGGPLDTDFMAESAGAMAGFGESASELEKRRETEQEQERQAEIDLEKQNEFYDTGNYRSEGYPGEARLLKEIEKNGTIYRQYEFNLTGERGKTAYSGYFIVAPGKDNIYNDAFRFEYPITDEAFEKGVDWGGININDFAFTNEQDNSNIILSGIFTNFKNKATSERENSLSSIFKDLGRDYQIDASKLDTGNFGSFLGKEEIQFEAGDEIEQKAEGIDETLKGSGFVSEVGGDSSGASPLGLGGPGQILDQTGNIARIEDVPGEFLDFEINEALSNFLATSPSLSLNLPVDAQGNRRNITPEDFPGFPAEILDPNNLFIRVTETTSIPDADGNMIPATTTKVVPNPAVELLLAQYAERIRGLTDLQGSADDILQAQISASGGFFGGPTGSLDIGQLEDLERETRSIQASGGRLVQEAIVDAEGNRTGQYKEILTPLGQAELDEATAARQQLLQQEALRQSGGLLGGFYSPLDAQGNPLEAGQQRFIGGLTPQQLLGRQEEEARRARQQEIEILERQRERDLQLARINQAPQQFRNIADLYSNPVQLAAIVASGGSPLLRGQLPGSSPIPQTSMQTGAMASQAQTASAPFNITNPSGTVFDPNFVPVGGRTQEGDLRRQEANPFNVRDFSGVTEQRLRNLSDIELARAQGEAAAQGITPTSLEEIGAGNTPGGPLDKTGFLAPKTLFY